MVAILPMCDIGRALNHMRLSSNFLNKCIWFNCTKSESLVEQGVAVVFWKFKGKTVDLPQLMAQYCLQKRGCWVKEILWSIFSVWIPFISTFCLIAASSGSMKVIKSYGESGQPCLVPLYRQKLSEMISFVLTCVWRTLYFVFKEITVVSNFLMEQNSITLINLRVLLA